jgi:hypothetical protein
MIPDTNVGGNIATISEVSDDQEKRIRVAINANQKPMPT